MSEAMPPKTIIWFDSEFDKAGKTLLDIGAVKADGTTFHSPNMKSFHRFIEGADILCGHNIEDFDLTQRAFVPHDSNILIADTLYLSALLFPQKRFHHLLKDEKLVVTELNNPVNDSRKAKDLFEQEIAAFLDLPEDRREIYFQLLRNTRPFRGFFSLQGMDEDAPPWSVEKLETEIKKDFREMVCGSVSLQILIQDKPVELAYALAVIQDPSLPPLPAWVMHRFPQSDRILQLLRHPQSESVCSCDYCRNNLVLSVGLKRWFGFGEFRSYAGEPLQEQAVHAAVHGKSLIAIFPTGGGKSLAFQLPALMAGTATRGLTVVISPLQSLMKDQVDHLVERGIDCATFINSLLNPIEYAEALRGVREGKIKILYIAPEQLRSRTVVKLLEGRRIERFVIDEAHCFSAWGHDFRVDYLYIGDFIAELQKVQTLGRSIPVSCFTATARQKVIQDIRDYFKEKLNLDLLLFSTNAQRENLRFTVMPAESKEKKYAELRELINSHSGSVIVYVSKVRDTEELSAKLSADGIEALPYNGKLPPEEKKSNQDLFLSDKVRVIVATTAFGMGVDKPDIGLVVHFNISASLENYVQEAGRAGRNPNLQAECYVLFSDDDLNEHFGMLNRSMLSFSDISQVWHAVKRISRGRTRFAVSELDIAKEIGWEQGATQEKTAKVRAALSVLERTNYLRRHQNTSRVYATSLRVKNVQEGQKIMQEAGISKEEKEFAIASMVLSSLLSASNSNKSLEDEDESRVDYLADNHGRSLKEIVDAVYRLRELGILSNDNDIVVSFDKDDTLEKSKRKFVSCCDLEDFLIARLKQRPGQSVLDLKQICTDAHKEGLTNTGPQSLRLILRFWRRSNLIKHSGGRDVVVLEHVKDIRSIEKSAYVRRTLGAWALEQIWSSIKGAEKTSFSLISLLHAYRQDLLADEIATKQTMEDAVLFLNETGAVHLEGGFLVIHRRLQIERLEKDNKRKFRKNDYREMEEYYNQRFQQVQIVGRFANILVQDHEAAMHYVRDYFLLDYKEFVNKHFKGELKAILNLHMTENSYRKIFGELSDRQKAIIEDSSQFIAVAAGPGSGKTHVLVRKLASLLWQEDVKHEQLLMLTFSRAAATEFKQRLVSLTNAAHYVEIRTFHSFCFDILGRYGTVGDSDGIIREAVEKIRSGEIDPQRISKSVLVLDEAQDLDGQCRELVNALIEKNENLRVIAVGDDDQTIYQFRGADSQYLRTLLTDREATFHQLLVNYRSASVIVDFANAFVKRLEHRLKSDDIRSGRADKGTVEITQYARSANLATPVAEALCSKRLQGTTCILTQTNRDAEQVFSELHRRDVPAIIVHGVQDGPKLFNMLETRWLLMRLRQILGARAMVGEDQWMVAIEEFSDKFATSKWLSGFLRLCREFRDTSPQSFYLSDFEEFLRFSQIEDLYEVDQETVYVSTIHKAKGREFDNVFLLLSSPNCSDEASKRTIYVGLTRARNSLMVHCRGPLFNEVHLPGVVIQKDTKLYSEPNELLVPLGYKDVVLDAFIDRKQEACRLRCGDELIVSSDGKSLGVQKESGCKPIIIFSQKFRKTLKGLSDEGYRIVSAQVMFVLAWQKQGREQTDAAVLAELSLKRPQPQIETVDLF